MSTLNAENASAAGAGTLNLGGEFTTLFFQTPGSLEWDSLRLPKNSLPLSALWALGFRSSGFEP